MTGGEPTTTEVWWEDEVGNGGPPKAQSPASITGTWRQDVWLGGEKMTEKSWGAIAQAPRGWCMIGVPPGVQVAKSNSDLSTKAAGSQKRRKPHPIPI